MVKKFILLTFVFGIILHFVLPVSGYCNTELKIGVVDISAVFDKYLKRIAFDKQLKDTEKHYEKDIDIKRNAIMLLKEEVELLDMGSKTRMEKEDAIREKSIEIEVYAKFAEQNLLQKYKECFQIIYIDVCKAVETYGEKNSFELVLKKEKPELKSNEISDLQFKIGINTVLYYSNAVDITPQIIKNINKSYSANVKK
ncbi:MAG: OmpH family outer membrane protein [Candidatus Anammoxibacter sp.]